MFVNIGCAKSPYDYSNQPGELKITNSKASRQPEQTKMNAEMLQDNWQQPIWS